jgi:hypothetical protein
MVLGLRFRGKSCSIAKTFAEEVKFEAMKAVYFSADFWANFRNPIF